MIQYTIFRGNEVILTTKNATGQVVQKIMAEHLVRFNISLEEYIDLQIGDTVMVFGKVYTMNTIPVARKDGNRIFGYTCEFQAPHYELNDVQFFALDAANQPTMSEFPLTYRAIDFVELIVRNANRIKSGWEVGTVIDTDYKLLSFTGNNCKEVLAALADAFETEYHIDGRTIHLYKRGDDLTAEPHLNTGLVFEYGKGKGVKGIERTNVDLKLTTRLYAYGSEKNLLGSYRGYSPRLLMPASVGSYLSKNEDKYGIKEEAKFFEDVYPYRVGTVTSVNGIMKFTDASIDFDVNPQLIDGLSVKINFLTGQLSGITFELLDPSGFNAATKEFTLLKSKDEKAVDLPNETLRPAVGDLYVMSDIIMPDSYVRNAENALQELAQFYLDQNSSPKLSYTIDCDILHFREQRITLELAQSVRIKDADFKVDKNIRIVGLERNINDAFDYKISIADSVKLLSAVLAAIKQRQRDQAIKDLQTPPRTQVQEQATAWRKVESSFFCELNAEGKKTGMKGWSTLEEYNLTTNALTGNTKPNSPTGTGYAAPVQDLVVCELEQAQPSVLDMDNRSALSVTVEMFNGPINRADAYTTDYLNAGEHKVSPLTLPDGITKINIRIRPTFRSAGGENLRATVNGQAGTRASGSTSWEYMDVVPPITIVITG